MFVRKKTTTSGTYHYLVESVRVDGRVRQRVLCYLAQYETVEAALAGLPLEVADHREKAAAARAEMAEYAERRAWLRRRPYTAKSLARYGPHHDAARHERLARDAAARLAKLRKVVAA